MDRPLPAPGRSTGHPGRYLGTGKFAGVTGSWVMVARSEPFVLGSDDPVAYSWEGQGQLTFRQGR